MTSTDPAHVITTWAGCWEALHLEEVDLEESLHEVDLERIIRWSIGPCPKSIVDSDSDPKL